MSTSSNNIWEATNITDLATLLRSYNTVILGLVLPETHDSDKVMIRKFLKDKSKKFNQLIFVYMVVPKECMGKLGIINLDRATYPLIYHIRNGNNILVAVERADTESIYGSFSEVERYYIDEMKEVNNEKKTNDVITGNESRTQKTGTGDRDERVKYEESFGSDTDEEQIIDANDKEVCAIDNDTINKKKENERKAEKIVFLDSEFEKYKIVFLKELQKRKKIEKDIVIEKDSTNKQ